MAYHNKDISIGFVSVGAYLHKLSSSGSLVGALEEVEEAFNDIIKKESDPGKEFSYPVGAKNRVAKFLLDVSGSFSEDSREKIRKYYCHHLRDAIDGLYELFHQDIIFEEKKHSLENNLDFDKIKDDSEKIFKEFLSLVGDYQIVEDALISAIINNKKFKRVKNKLSKSVIRYGKDRTRFIKDNIMKLSEITRNNPDIANSFIIDGRLPSGGSDVRKLSELDTMFGMGVGGIHRIYNKIFTMSFHCGVGDFIKGLCIDINKYMGREISLPEGGYQIKITSQGVSHEISLEDKFGMLSYLKTPRTEPEIVSEYAMDGDSLKKIIEMSFDGKWQLFKNITKSGRKYYLALPKAEVIIDRDIDRDVFVAYDYDTNTLNIQKDSEDTKIFFSTITDLHEGLTHINPEARDRFFEIVKKNNIYLVATGDLLENASKGSVGDGWLHQDTPPYEQILSAKRRLEPIRDHLLGMVGGNHSYNRKSRSGIDVEQVLADLLGVPFTDDYMAACFTLNGVSFVNWCWHGSGGSATEGGKINSSMRPYKFSENVDVYWSGHFHDFKRFSKTVLSFDILERKAVERVVHFVMQGGFDEYNHTWLSRIGRPPSVKQFAVGQFNCENRGVKFYEFDLNSEDFLVNRQMEESSNIEDDILDGFGIK